MTVLTSAERKPRRKWGWLFVIAFLIQAVVFAAIIIHTMGELHRERGLQNSLLRSHPNSVSTWRVNSLRNDINLLSIGAAASSIGMLFGAVMGFRRRK